LVLVDSSVWTDYLSPRASQVAAKLETLIRPNNEIIITGIIFQEILQGIRNIRSYRLTQQLLQRLPFVIPSVNTHLKAAEIFRELSSKGKIPSTVDALIAALAIENKIPLFTLDADFCLIQQYSALKLF